jgi:hypothetical protein
MVTGGFAAGPNLSTQKAVLDENWATLTPAQKKQRRFQWWLDAEGVKFASPQAEKAYKQRVQRMIDVYEVKQPDRVPVNVPIGHLPAHYAGLDYHTVMYEPEKAIAAWEKFKKSGKMITVEGREIFDLVLEIDGWKIFLDWRSQHRVVFKTSRPLKELEVKFLRNDLLVKQEEPFQVDIRVTNRTDRDIVAKLNHLFEPRRIEKNIDMIACGSLLPLRLRPQETQEISSSYLLRGKLLSRAQLAIIYDFDLLPKAEKQNLFTIERR